MNRTVALALGLALLAGLGAFAVAAVTVAEPDSAFVAGGPGPWPLVADAAALGLDARRVVSTPVAALADGAPPQQTLLAVLDAPRPFTPQEAEAVARFLEAGGRVLLADPYGHADTLAAAHGVRFQRVRLVDPAPDATARLEGAAFRVAWENPSALLLAPGTPATVLSSSSPRSFLDRDGNGTIDAADPQGTFAVAAEVPVGTRGGRLVAVADLGPFRGAGADMADNAVWRRALLSHLLPEGGRLLVDESRQAHANPLAALLATSVAAATLQPWAWVLWAVAAVLLLATLPAGTDPRWGQHRFDPRRFIRRAEVADPPAAPPQVHARAVWTQRGSLALCGSLALALLALAFSSPTAAGAAALLGVAAAGAFLQPPARLTAVRHLSVARPAEGGPIEASLTVAAASRWTVHAELLDPLPPEFALTAGTNWAQVAVQRDAPARLHYTFTPALRGPHQVGPLATRVADPLRLRAVESVAAPPADLRVAPRQQPVRRIPFTTRVPTVTLGPHFVNRAGEGSEFHALRDYAQGDSLRSVNWKASARAGGLMVNQRVHESMTRLTVLLDARAVSGAGPAAATPLAEGCRVALSVAAGALRVRDRVRVVAYGDGLTEMRDAPGSRQLHELEELLAALPARGTTGLAEAVAGVAASLRPNTPVLVVSGAEADPGFVEAMRTLRGRGCIAVLVASPIHLEPAAGAPERGAEALRASRAAALAGVRALGIPVYETVPGLPLDDLFRLGGGA